MRGSEPSWWYGTGPQWPAKILSPVGTLVGTIAAAKLRHAKPYRSFLPVICVGNFTAGGSGKTPLAIRLARIVSDLGHEAWFLSRGYGGTFKGPLQVNPAVHTARDVGDEPLLLARHAHTVISPDRAEGAKLIEAAASRNAVIIMDDGLQNPSLAKDFSIAVVDAERGFGNGRIIPAGPLRAPLAAQVGLANAIVLSGGAKSERAAVTAQLREMTSAPIIRTETHATEGSTKFAGQKVIAYAGIANPDRFFSMLGKIGAEVIERRAFADHHTFSESEAGALLEAARRTGASLVTTEKDFVRLSQASPAVSELKARSTVLAIETVIDAEGLATLTELIKLAIVR